MLAVEYEISSGLQKGKHMHFSYQRRCRQSFKGWCIDSE